MREQTWWGRLANTPLFWRVFGLNAAVFLVGAGSLALTPATVSWPLQLREMLLLAAGLLALLVLNGLLLRVGFAPLDRLMDLMAGVDLLRPGQRIPVAGRGRLARLARTFNEMLARLEAERAASTAHILEAQERERRRIARELHDEIGQSLTVILLEVSRLVDQVPRALQPTLSHVLEATRDSLADVRSIAQRLRPDALEQLGLGPALTALVNEFSDFSGVAARLRLDRLPAQPEDVELVIYRVAQESLTNVARHAGAHSVDVHLERDPAGRARLLVSDDGRGLQQGHGGGIQGMRERALLVGGRLEISSAAGRGTQVVLIVPLPHPESRESRESVDAGHTHTAR